MIVRDIPAIHWYDPVVFTRMNGTDHQADVRCNFFPWQGSAAIGSTQSLHKFSSRITVSGANRGETPLLQVQARISPAVNSRTCMKYPFHPVKDAVKPASR
jgi:hypothetical protein